MPNSSVSHYTIDAVILCVCVDSPQLRELLKERPVVLLPSHRSYLDFILVTFILFNFNMKLPCIAAGQGESHDCHKGQTPVVAVQDVQCKGGGWLKMNVYQYS